MACPKAVSGELPLLVACGPMFKSRSKPNTNCRRLGQREQEVLQRGGRRRAEVDPSDEFLAPKLGPRPTAVGLDDGFTAAFRRTSCQTAPVLGSLLADVVPDASALPRETGAHASWLRPTERR